MACSQAPQFGNWEDEIRYSAYFDNASKGKESGQIHQNDPQNYDEVELKDQKASEAKMSNHMQCSGREEGELKGCSGSPNGKGHKPAIDSSPKWHNPAQSRSDKLEPEMLRPRHVCRLSREEDVKGLTDSPLHNEIASQRNSLNSPHHHHGGSSAGETPRRVARQSVGSDHSIDQSPLHPHSQARVGGNNSGSPSWERKAASDGSHGLAPLTPGRSRLRSVTRGDDSPEQSPAVPKFGDWDETDPATAEGYTQIFNRVREEKHNETGKVPSLATEKYNSNGRKQYGDYNPKGCSCFPWGKR